jgi:acetoacetyl-CoA synthetase
LRREDDGPAMIATTETGADRMISWAALSRDVRRAAEALRRAGVGHGDRVCGVMANVPEAIVAALAASAIGAVWSSCSPDFGVQGIVDRFGQIEPVALLTVDGYRYGGKRFDCLAKCREVADRIPSIRTRIVVPLAGGDGTLPGAVEWNSFLESGGDGLSTFDRFPFNDPLYILYSSGTTGVPKCIVHGAGGTLLQHLKEHQLHADVRPGDRVFYFTTCGWMMWNWLVTALASEATLVLYDGSPLHPDARVLFDLADRAGVTLFGTSAKYIDAVRKSGLRPRETHDLRSVRTITSTGSPLALESFDFVYADIKTDVHLASISGGTDIASCFVGGNPNAPVWSGEIQAAGLGMSVEIFDDAGRPLADEAGELVCTASFPSMPVGFWNDPDGSKYRAAYFERFPGVWHHGDWARRTEHHGFIIFGRSDATLKPGGVRIGTAEIYRQVEQLPEVLESLAVGQQWNNDERIVLFVRLAPGAVLDDAMRKRIAERIRTNASPRHVPARIIAVADIPRTKSGKIVELAVRNVIHGRAVTNREALANPEALDAFRDLAELKQ